MAFDIPFFVPNCDHRSIYVTARHEPDLRIHPAREMSAISRQKVIIHALSILRCEFFPLGKAVTLEEFRSLHCLQP